MLSYYWHNALVCLTRIFFRATLVSSGHARLAFVGHGPFRPFPSNPRVCQGGWGMSRSNDSHRGIGTQTKKILKNAKKLGSKAAQP